ncbi:LysR family transcriptional regulator, partial [Lactobacillus nasalidis]
MQHKYLECFLALAKYRNFSEAAEQMYISQSSFSKSIKKLENDLGVQLFNRGASGVTLTEYGQSYLPYANKIINLYKQAEREIAQLKSREQALRIGTIPSAAEYGILDFLIKFMNESGYQCQISTGPSGQLEEELAAGKLDFAFIKNCQNPHFEYLPYQSDRLMVVLPAADPLAGQKTVKL